MKITKLMNKDHDNILNFFRVFNSLPYQEKKTTEQKMNLLNSIKWDLERHFLAEEKEIFTAFLEYDQNEVTQRLIDEHRRIMQTVNEIEEKVKSGEELDFSKLKALLLSHQKYEDEEFYPLLESLLNQNKSDELYEKMNTLVD